MASTEAVIKTIEDELKKGKDLLSRQEVLTVWKSLIKNIQKQKHEKIGESFDEFEKAVNKHYSLTAKKLNDGRKQYSKWKKEILAMALDIDGKQSGTQGKHVSTLYVDPKQQQQQHDHGTKAFEMLYELIKWQHSFLTGENYSTTNQNREEVIIDSAYQDKYEYAHTMLNKFKDEYLRLKEKEKQHPGSEEVHNTQPTGTQTDTKRQSETTDIRIVNEKSHQSLVHGERECLESKCKTLEEDISALTKKLKRSEEEREYWMNRMSKAAGEKLTENNPVITDLSDPNRPQILAEKYGELYDNEWTDAMEKLMPRPDDKHERERIAVLVQILQSSYRECKKVADDQLQDLENVVMMTKAEPSRNIKPCAEGIKRSLQDTQNQAANYTTNFVIEIVKREKRVEKIKELPAFINKCIEICWSMVVKTPRMCFQLPEKSGKIDMNMFQLYTRSGDTLDYVVWPAMLLHENGPILRRGVVQAKK